MPAPAGAVGDGLRIASAPAALLLVEAEHGSNGAEHALQRSEARLQAAVELVGLSPYGWDPATGALEWDARLKAMWGLPADAHVDQAVWLSAIHPEDRPRVEAAVTRCCDPAGDGVYKIDYRVIGIEDGVERWVSTHGRTQFENGRPIRFVGVALDITERKRDEAVSRARAERFRQFAEHSANVLWLANLKSRRLTYLSPAVRHVWGVPPERLTSIEDWLDTIHPDDRDSVERAVERVGSGDVVVLEYRILRPSDGIVRRIRDTFFPIRGEEGGIRHVGGIAADVTGRTGTRIYVVDRDAESRQKLLALLHPAGYEVQLFESPAALAEVAESLQPGCVILDLEAAEPDGLTVARALKVGRLALPVLVVGRSHGDVGFGVRAMKAGAVDYLEKPWQPSALLTAVSAALAELRTDNERSQARDDAKQRIGALSAREREVLEGLLAGGTNKSIGRALGLSPRTVEIHRAHVMETLGVRTLPEAVLMAAKAGVQPTDAL
ncbi:PAS domain-containing protein [Methylorubrum populi]|uniref:PAS domain-containing protein n=1 Tax=Methylorubrum populi TaxID=223967 RepID=UPI001FCADC53|nr:PAS domain-containing protein [Methylorubrum populi]